MRFGHQHRPSRPQTSILTWELVYMGVTRAKGHVTVVRREALLRTALLRPLQRASGLASRLWPDV